MTAKNLTVFSCQLCPMVKEEPYTTDSLFIPAGWYQSDEYTHACPECVQKIKHFIQVEEG